LTVASGGHLFVVSTPIGDVADLSPRAREVLARASLVAAEDTRVARKLYGQLGLEAPELWSCHDHNEARRAGPVVARLDAGQDVVLVSDAGTPLVSDPGYRVVRAVIDAGRPVVPVPGPSAPLAALVASGLPTDRFTFAGFPPQRSGKRRAWLADLGKARGTLVLFEAPHRVEETLADAEAVLGDREACLAISLTKTWERFHRGSFSSIRATLQADPEEVIGEMTLVVAGAEESSGDRARWEPVVDALAQAGVSPAVIRDAVAGPLGARRRDVYQRALRAASDAADG